MFRQNLQGRPRRNLWNLLILPFAIISMCFVGWGLSIPLDHLARLGMPEDFFLEGSSGFGWFLRYFSLGIISIAPGLVIGNCCMWFIPFVRVRLDMEASRNPRYSFGSSNVSLIKFGLYIFIVLYPLAAVGAMRHFSAAHDGIFNRPWFSSHVVQYPWSDVKRVSTECDIYKSKNSWQREGKFIVIMKDGTEVDLVAGWYKDFFVFYPQIVTLLRSANYEFHYTPPQESMWLRPCPNDWVPYFVTPPAR